MQVLAVVFEIARGAKSRWAPYLAALPAADELHCPVLWSDKQLAWLAGTGVATVMNRPEDDTEEVRARPTRPLFARPQPSGGRMVATLLVLYYLLSHPLLPSNTACQHQRQAAPPDALPFFPLARRPRSCQT